MAIDVIISESCWMGGSSIIANCGWPLFHHEAHLGVASHLRNGCDFLLFLFNVEGIDDLCFNRLERYYMLGRGSYIVFSLIRRTSLKENLHTRQVVLFSVQSALLLPL